FSRRPFNELDTGSSLGMKALEKRGRGRGKVEQEPAKNQKAVSLRARVGALGRRAGSAVRRGMARAKAKGRCATSGVAPGPSFCVYTNPNLDPRSVPVGVNGGPGSSRALVS